MSIVYKTTKENINWEEVADILKQAHLSDCTPEEQQTMFKNSYAVIFAYDDVKIIGVGRALSDGVCQAAVYNIALREEYRGQGIGKELIRRLLEQVKGQNIILYTHPKNIVMYEKMGFRRNKSAMSIFASTPEHLKWQEKMGFFLPEGYRFEDEVNREDMQYRK